MLSHDYFLIKVCTVLISQAISGNLAIMKVEVIIIELPIEKYQGLSLGSIRTFPGEPLERIF